MRHDGLVLCEVLNGELAGVHSPSLAGANLRIWEVNPLVKVFPETAPQAEAGAVSMELARNEYHAFELALRVSARHPAESNHVTVSVSPLRSRTGAELPPVKIDHVGYVPVDYPSAYYTSEAPEWCRKVPKGAAATDGWAGWWPDPLAPASSVELRPERTETFWFTVHSPEQAKPGQYLGEVTFKSDADEVLNLPLTVQVLPFALPETGKLRAIFDFRFGPGGGFGSGAEGKDARRQWLRFLAEHRLGVDAIEPAPKFSYRDGKVSMDAAEFDEAAHFSLTNSR